VIERDAARPFGFCHYPCENGAMKNTRRSEDHEVRASEHAKALSQAWQDAHDKRTAQIEVELLAERSQVSADVTVQGWG
jgi:hypothetical protein